MKHKPLTDSGEVIKLMFSYDEVCDILCEACRLKIPDVFVGTTSDAIEIYHSINGVRIDCAARSWRISRTQTQNNEP